MMNKSRRSLASVSWINTAQLHLRNPFVAAFWSAMFPGFGHLLLSQYMKGLILFLWEIFLNLKAHVNLALLYSLLGDFERVRGAVDIRWSLLYIPTYVFAIWDSYRSAVGLNRQCILAEREAPPVDAFTMNPVSVTFLDKRSPFVTAAWCATEPGLSHLMLHRLLHAVFLVFWWIVIVYRSNILTAVHLSCFGAFEKAKSVTDPQWLLNIPSLFFFCVYAAYVNAVESNKLFDLEQSQFLRDTYHGAEFPFPSERPEERGPCMYVVSVFRQSVEVELAVTSLEQEGVLKKDILAVPVSIAEPNRRLFDSIRSSTGDSLFDLPMLLGAFAAFIGCVYGYILAWGPVVWGVLDGIAGFAVGFLIKLLLIKRDRTAGQENDAVIFVHCDDASAEKIKGILRSNGALGVGVAASP